MPLYTLGWLVWSLRKLRKSKKALWWKMRKLRAQRELPQKKFSKDTKKQSWKQSKQYLFRQSEKPGRRKNLTKAKSRQRPRSFFWHCLKNILRRQERCTRGHYSTYKTDLARHWTIGRRWFTFWDAKDFHTKRLLIVSKWKKEHAFTSFEGERRDTKRNRIFGNFAISSQKNNKQP